jgi:hypothetical protein
MLAIQGYSPEVSISVSRGITTVKVAYRGHKNLSANLRKSARIGFGVAKIRVNARTKWLTTFTCSRIRSISTRNYYTGGHALEIQVNGTGHKKVNFELKT